MTAYRVLAKLSLKPTSEGGLAQPLPGGTRSRLLPFPDGCTRESWASECARLCWAASRLAHGKTDTGKLAAAASFIIFRRVARAGRVDPGLVASQLTAGH